MTVRVYAPELYEPKRAYRNDARDEFLRANAGVDPALLAADLNLTEWFVRMLQRQLGLRHCTYSPRKADRHR